MLLLPLLLLLFACNTVSSLPAESIAFKVRYVGFLGSASTKSPQIIVIKSQDEMKALAKLGTVAAGPRYQERPLEFGADVFERESFLFVVSGWKGSTGHEVLVAKVNRGQPPNTLLLEIREISPAESGWGSDPAVTYPCTLISINRCELTNVVKCVDGKGQPWPATFHKAYKRP